MIITMKIPPLFNPSNDMALAVNLRQYTPPRHIQQMEADLADLAQFWDEGPWGWSLATKQYYLRLGIPETELPTDEWLAEHRRLSSREFAIAYYQELISLLSSHEEGRNLLLPCQARYITSFTPQELFALCESQRDGEVNLSPLSGSRKGLILKSPWSSSGRGNILVRDTLDASTIRRIEKIIAEQGGIVVEPFYADKVLDFAMEFWADGSATRFLGYSVFSADEMGHYGGNRVESQAELLRCVALPEPLLQCLIDYHQSKLSRLSYRGPVGIDMMRLADGRVHPCVEINFRRTMGHLALALYEKGLTADQLLAGNPQQGFSAQVIGGRLSIVCRS